VIQLSNLIKNIFICGPNAPIDMHQYPNRNGRCPGYDITTVIKHFNLKKYDRSEKHSFTASMKTLKTLSHSRSKVLFLLVLSPLFLLQILNCFPHPFSLASLYLFSLCFKKNSRSNKEWTRKDIKWRQ